MCRAWLLTIKLKFIWAATHFTYHFRSHAGLRKSVRWAHENQVSHSPFALDISSTECRVHLEGFALDSSSCNVRISLDFHFHQLQLAFAEVRRVKKCRRIKWPRAAERQHFWDGFFFLFFFPEGWAPMRIYFLNIYLPGQRIRTPMCCLVTLLHSALHSLKDKFSWHQQVLVST